MNVRDGYSLDFCKIVLGTVHANQPPRIFGFCEIANVFWKTLFGKDEHTLFFSVSSSNSLLVNLQKISYSQ